MKDLVFIENGRAITDSLTVAEVFGKEHFNVINDIKNQIEKLNAAGEQEWGALNFQETQYQHQQNKQWYTKFNMTEDAFALVAMSYVTPEAMKMKIRFLDEFKRLREQLQHRPPQMSQLEMVAYLAQQAVIREKEDARRDQDIQSLKSGMNTLTDNLTAIPDAAKVVDLVNEYARWTRIGHNEIYNRVYDIMKDQHGIDVPQKVKNEREKLNQAQIAAKGKPYAESTLKSKVNGIDVMVRNGWLEKFSVILSGLLAKEKTNALPVFEG
ncbi:Rha family transcriptional regulator [Brevibacillus reuszeri]|uniref:Rha family transcriptional regulator n=1 Tax=Brevibacillus reuszeri TaxID=54915 RepID=UPI000CCBF643|nr:Rha family transcriptional regulator [Brevibacillus reuszeri]